MPAHPARRLHGSLQVHKRAGRELAQRRLPQRFRGQSHGERNVVESRDGQARAVDGDAVAEVNALQDALGGYLHVESAGFGGSDVPDFAHFFDDSGEQTSDCGGSRLALTMSGFVEKEGESGWFGNGGEFQIGFGGKSVWGVGGGGGGGGGGGED